jgi:hypothetical protein
MKRICTILLSFGLGIALLAQEGPLLNVQGVLKGAGGGALPDGAQTMTFKLYKEPSGGSALWQEIADVNVTGGVYSHDLGSEVPLNLSDFNEQLYLGITIDGLELSPRARLTSAPYAMRAFAVNSAKKQVGCLGALGDVKMSPLPPQQFRAENGDCWVLMDGQGLNTDNPLREMIGIEAIPDARGVFLRAIDGRGIQQGGRDPRGENPQVGSYQEDDVGAHRHEVNDPGHNHTYYDRVHRQNDDKGAEEGPFNEERVATDPPHHPAPDTTQLSVSGIEIPNSGGHHETRPANLNFYVYLRIR